MRGDKFGTKMPERPTICPRCGSYDIIPLVNLDREEVMCQKCGFVIENEKGRK